MVPTTYSESTDMTSVMPTNQVNALQNPITAFSSSSSSWISNSQIQIPHLIKVVT